MSAGAGTSRAQPVTAAPAEVYEERFVPALFGPWAETVARLSGIAPGDHVLDVACGTGALACAAARRALPGGAVTGVDPNVEMLAVARRKRADVGWREGRAESLPFPDAAFDRVVSQFGAMFFEDRTRALREMQRVLRPGGTLSIAVCDGIDHSPGYAVLTELLHRLFGSGVAEAFRAPFALGDRRRLADWAREAGLAGARVERHEGTVRFDSVASLVATERACAWTLGGLLDDAQFGRLLEEAGESLQPFVGPDGGVRFGMPALVLSSRKA